MPTSPARADDYWNETKRYTASIYNAAADAAAKLKQAKSILDDAKSALGAATCRGTRWMPSAAAPAPGT